MKNLLLYYPVFVKFCEFCTLSFLREALAFLNAACYNSKCLMCFGRIGRKSIIIDFDAVRAD